MGYVIFAFCLSFAMFILRNISINKRKQAKEEWVNIMENQMDENNFDKSISFGYYDALIGGYKVYVDETNEEMIILNTSKETRKTLKFMDIIDMEFIDDGENNNGKNRAIVGGLLFGVAGAVVGSSTGEKYISNAKIIIYVNNIRNPQIELLLTDQRIKVNGVEYNKIMDFARKLNGTIRSILAQNEV